MTVLPRALPPRRFKFWKNKSIFLFNIVVADFLLVACLPFKAHHYRHQLRRSNDDVACKTMLFMLFLNRGASIAFLITLSIDRYFNVVRLGRRNFVKILKKTPQISIVIWLLLLPLTIPTMVRTFECCNSHGRVVETYLHDVTDTFREVSRFFSSFFFFFPLNARFAPAEPRVSFLPPLTCGNVSSFTKQFEANLLLHVVFIFSRQRDYCFVNEA